MCQLKCIPSCQIDIVAGGFYRKYQTLDRELEFVKIIQRALPGAPPRPLTTISEGLRWDRDRYRRLGLVEPDWRRLWKRCGDPNSHSCGSRTTPPETKAVGKYEVAPHQKPAGRTHTCKFNGSASHGDSKRPLKTAAAGEVETLAFVRNMYRRYLRGARALEVHPINYNDAPRIYLLSGTPTIQPSLLRPATRKVGCNTFRWEISNRSTTAVL